MEKNDFEAQLVLNRLNAREKLLASVRGKNKGFQINSLFVYLIALWIFSRFYPSSLEARDLILPIMLVFATLLFYIDKRSREILEVLEDSKKN